MRILFILLIIFISSCRTVGIQTTDQKYNSAKNLLKKGEYQLAYLEYSNYFVEHHSRIEMPVIKKAVNLFNQHPKVWDALLLQYDIRLSKINTQMEYDAIISDIRTLNNRNIITDKVHKKLLNKIENVESNLKNKIQKNELVKKAKEKEAKFERENSFYIKGFYLGMSEYEIKTIARKLDQKFYDKHPNVYRVHIKKLVDCHTSRKNNEKTCSFSSTQIFDSITKVRVSLLNNSAYSINFTFSDYEYSYIKKGIINKYGKPNRSSMVTKSNAMNAKYTGERLIWTKNNYTMYLEELGGERDISEITIINDKKLQNKIDEKMKSDSYKM